MMKSLSLMSAGLVAGVAFLGGGTPADARCATCAPIKPVYTYRTVNQVSHQTRYRDVTRTRYVQRVQPIVQVTRVRPIVHFHEVTRVHHRTIPVYRPVYVNTMQYLPAQHYYSSSVVNTYDCGCR